MNFKQRSLKDFQNEHKAKQHPTQQKPRNKQIHTPKPLKERKDARLPDKSEFHCYYNATTQKWSGTLVICTSEKTKKVFTEEVGAIFHLLYKLDKLYRKWLKEQSGNDADKVKML